MTVGVWGARLEARGVAGSVVGRQRSLRFNGRGLGAEVGVGSSGCAGGLETGDWGWTGRRRVGGRALERQRREGLNEGPGQRPVPGRSRESGRRVCGAHVGREGIAGKGHGAHRGVTRALRSRISALREGGGRPSTRMRAGLQGGFRDHRSLRREARGQQ